MKSQFHRPFVAEFPGVGTLTVYHQGRHNDFAKLKTAEGLDYRLSNGEFKTLTNLMAKIGDGTKPAEALENFVIQIREFAMVDKGVAPMTDQQSMVSRTAHQQTGPWKITIGQLLAHKGMSFPRLVPGAA